MANLRRSDQFGRLGGEEFAFLLPDTDKARAWQFADRFRRLVAETPAPSDKGAIAFTISVGLAEFGPDDSTIDSVLAHADAALYCAKEGGRNRVSESSCEAKESFTSVV
jgi:diguanylate cyclase (GGDEF)-like protein